VSTAAADEHHKHVRAFKMVLIVLLIGTVVTVAASRIHFGHYANIAVALLIATVKASLVALIFMHLKAERAFLYSVLALCVVFFAALMLLPVLTDVEAVGTDIQAVASPASADHAPAGGEHATDGH